MKLLGLDFFQMYTDSDPDDPVVFELGRSEITPPISAEGYAWLGRLLEEELFFPLGGGEDTSPGGFFPWLSNALYRCFLEECVYETCTFV